MKTTLMNTARFALAAADTALVLFAACKQDAAEDGEKKYSVNISLIANGTITASPSKQSAGKTVRLTASANPTYRLTPGSIKVNGGLVTLIETETSWNFLMPAEDVAVEGKFEDALSMADFEELTSWQRLSAPYWYGGNGDAQQTTTRHDGKYGSVMYYAATGGADGWTGFGKRDLDFDLSPYVAVSFWAKSGATDSVDNQFRFSLVDVDGTSFVQNFKVDQADTWKKITIPIEDIANYDLNLNNIASFNFYVNYTSGTQVDDVWTLPSGGSLFIDSVKGERP